jgi:scyllo-inositol 2-dehydrogenase (NADP+)
VRRHHPDARVEESADAVWQRAGDHDFVVIATPNDSHATLARAAIDTGLAVVVDKPLAPSSALAAELVDYAEAAGIPLTVFHNRRWDSDVLTLRRLLEDGELGEVHRFESRFERWRPELAGDAWRERLTSEEGGGLLLDLGTHLVDQALLLFGPAEDVYGEVEARRGGPANDDVFIAIRHHGGVTSHLWASSVAAARGPRLRVLGSEAAFVVDGLDGQEGALREGRRPSNGTWGEEPESKWGRLVRGEESTPVPSERGAWPEFYSRFEAALNSEGELPVDPRAAIEVARVLERAAAN